MVIGVVNPLISAGSRECGGWCEVFLPCGCFAVLRIVFGEENPANGDAVPRIICRFFWDSDDDPQSGEASAGITFTSIFEFPISQHSVH